MPSILRLDGPQLDPRALVDDDTIASPTVPALVKLEQWLKWRSEGQPVHPETGVWLEPDDEFEALAPDMPLLTLIAVNFPVFTDGRGYSIARLLRTRLGYTGQLRATGDVLRDQLYFLRRCGFDAFALRDDQDVEAALAALEDYSVRYQ